MATLSVCMIVKDEAGVLDRCLSCVSSFADEIVIVDTGSMDETLNIAARYTDRIYSFRWIYDFSAARNYAFSKACCEYIMWLDADDVIEKPDRLVMLKQTLTADVVKLPYHVGFDEDGVTVSYYRERIVRKSCGFQWVEPVHEYIATWGSFDTAEIPVLHRPLPCKQSGGRNLRIYQDMEEKGKPFSARALYYYARELKDHQMYEKSIQIYQEFLERQDVWVEDRINAYTGLSECLLGLQQYEEALKSLYRTFLYDLPRAEVCCRIAAIYLEQQQYKKAVYWYQLALHAKPQAEGFIWHDFHGFIPHIQLCVCWYWLGDLAKAQKHNELAGRIKPHHKAYLHNLNYFKEESN